MKIKQAYPKDYDGTDALMSVTLFLPGQKPSEFRLKVKGILGHIPKGQIKPELIKQCFIDGLRAKFGNHVE